MPSSVYDAITAQIITAIASGAAAGTWRMPWHTTSGHPIFAPINAVSRKPYRGINTLVLWAAADTKGYPSGTWATYRQWHELGAQVTKGEKATQVVFWKIVEQEAEDGEEAETHWLARAYAVFNAAQVTGYTPPDMPGLDPATRISTAEAFFAGLGATIRHGHPYACYVPAADEIRLPAFAQFTDPVSYYAILGHEHIHWVGHETRLHRDLTHRFGSAAYAAEELIAELGAAFLCAALGLAVAPRADHAQYIQSWLTVLHEDTRAIFTAASKAQQAVDWLHARAHTAPVS
jgi:antirestriction protein ArdC